MEEIKVGDVVCLKSGSEPITIVKISDDWIVGTYYVKGGQMPGIKRELFEPDPAIFIKVEPKKDENATT
jgi:uncharacterized protein YodC (DUF2158 family)